MSAVGTDNIGVRDQDGWRIPRDGSKSRRIYDLLLEGCSHRQIQQEVGGSLNCIRVLIYYMRHPEKHNEDVTRWRNENSRS